MQLCNDILSAQLSTMPNHQGIKHRKEETSSPYQEKRRHYPLLPKTSLRPNSLKGSGARHRVQKYQQRKVSVQFDPQQILKSLALVKMHALFFRTTGSSAVANLCNLRACGSGIEVCRLSLAVWICAGWDNYTKKCR